MSGTSVHARLSPFTKNAPTMTNSSSGMSFSNVIASSTRAPLRTPRMLQWSFWAMTEAEKPLLTVYMQRAELPAGSEIEKYFRARSPKDPATEQAAIKALEHPLSVLNGKLAKHQYLLGDSFTLADLNVASVLSMGLAAKFDFSPYPNVQQWLGRCVSRPAARPPKKS